MKHDVNWFFLHLGVLLLELVSMQHRALGTPSSLTRREALTTLALQSIIRCCKVGSLIFGIRKNGWRSKEIFREGQKYVKVYFLEHQHSLDINVGKYWHLRSAEQKKSSGFVVPCRIIEQIDGSHALENKHLKKLTEDCLDSWWIHVCACTA